MNPISRASSPSVRPGLTPLAPGKPAQSPPQPTPDGLALKAPAQPAPQAELHALRSLHGLTRSGGRLHSERGEPLTAEQALECLINGQEVLARIQPPRGPMRSASSLLLSLEDATELPRRLA